MREGRIIVKSAFDALGKSYSQVRSDLKAARLGGMLPLAKGLREFFREQITLEQAEEGIKTALDRRDEGFLQLVRTQIFNRPGSPYLKLLRMAGCDFGDLEAHVHQRGLERTLEKLCEEGVYLTSDEFKGKKEVIRKGASFRVSPERLPVFRRSTRLCHSEFRYQESSRGLFYCSELACGESVGNASFFGCP